MKISQLLISILVLLAGGAAVMYSADQQKVMNALIATHGGGQQIDVSNATGLRKLNQDLDAERGTGATERSSAIKLTEAARVEMRDAITRRDEMQAQLDAHKEELKNVQADVKAMQASVDTLVNAFNEAMAEIKKSESVEVDASADFTAVLEAIKEAVKKLEDTRDEQTKLLEDRNQERTKLVSELAALRVELARLTAINDKFVADYQKNDDEYPVLAVDGRWKFVVFNAGAESGLLPGDSTPVLVKRGGVVITQARILSVSNGVVVAEYDPKKLMPGVRPELGDRVFRVKPIGN
jgi:peptidoglycan hydrolase CwlO-like protein